jgi:hypothetical protein
VPRLCPRRPQRRPLGLAWVLLGLERWLSCQFLGFAWLRLGFSFPGCPTLSAIWEGGGPWVLPRSTLHHCLCSWVPLRRGASPPHPMSARSHSLDPQNTPGQKPNNPTDNSDTMPDSHPLNPHPNPTTTTQTTAYQTAPFLPQTLASREAHHVIVIILSIAVLTLLVLSLTSSILGNRRQRS